MTQGLSPVEQELLAVAREVRGAAYAPYSTFQVGAALRTTTGEVITGVNVENAAYPAGICAERSAVATAVTRGLRDFSAIAVAGPGSGPTPPCGICRQVLNEFAPDLIVIAAGAEGPVGRYVLGADLLPHAFGPTRLADGGATPASASSPRSA